MANWPPTSQAPAASVGRLLAGRALRAWHSTTASSAGAVISVSCALTRACCSAHSRSCCAQACPSDSGSAGWGGRCSSHAASTAPATACCPSLAFNRYRRCLSAVHRFRCSPCCFTLAITAAVVATAALPLLLPPLPGGQRPAPPATLRRTSGSDLVNAVAGAGAQAGHRQHRRQISTLHNAADTMSASLLAHARRCRLLTAPATKERKTVVAKTVVAIGLPWAQEAGRAPAARTQTHGSHSFGAPAAPRPWLRFSN